MSGYHGCMAELVFEVVQEADGGYCAECLTENIFTEGDTWEELRKNVLEATSAYFFDRPQPRQVRLRFQLADTLCRRWPYDELASPEERLF